MEWSVTALTTASRTSDSIPGRWRTGEAIAQAVYGRHGVIWQAGPEPRASGKLLQPSIVELTIKSTKQRYPKAFGGKKRRRVASVFETLMNNLTHAIFLGSIGNCEN
ncbi:hypothetical protein NP945_19350 [Mesorhizobium sp. LMG17149]|uniref:hypothetical protein n=1 Tax=Mesorhizobium sp. LMG17149 TaxID=2968497 RepID=UPI002119198D|nr:hypothetical protein [Mesorhizobium sp. LMG17149]MCQ8873997.1 hypothetical protein [Mesorhizobium sp. LMG17149]